MCVARLVLGVMCLFALAAFPGAGFAHDAQEHGYEQHHGAEPYNPRKAKHREPRSRVNSGRKARRHGSSHSHSHGAPPAHDAGHALGPGGHAHDSSGSARRASGDVHDHASNTEHIFGFIEGSDLHAPGETELKLDNIGRFMKRGGTYAAVESKAEIHTGVTGELDFAFGFLGDFRRIRAVPGLEEVPQRAAFSGASVEMRLRFLRRDEAGIGVTLLVEPSVSRYDELTGIRASRIGSENALLIDTEFVPTTLFGAVNVIYDIERTRERGALTTERGSTAGIGGALTYRVLPNLFLGGEARYLRAYEGLGLNRYQGEAVYLGPTLFAAITSRLTVTAAYSIQVAGNEALDRRGMDASIPAGEEPGLIRRSSLNLINFERHQVRLKIAYDF